MSSLTARRHPACLASSLGQTGSLRSCILLTYCRCWRASSAPLAKGASDQRLRSVELLHRQNREIGPEQAGTMIACQIIARGGETAYPSSCSAAQPASKPAVVRSTAQRQTKDFRRRNQFVCGTSHHLRRPPPLPPPPLEPPPPMPIRCPPPPWTARCAPGVEA
jgi:hypothetical protein